MSKKNDDGLPHAEVLKTLANQVGGAQSDMDAARGKVGSLFKNGEEKHGISRKAFKLALTLKKMDSSKLNEFLRHFDHYRGAFDLDTLAGSDAFTGPVGGFSPDADDADLRPPHLIENERQRLEEQEVVDTNVRALKGGLKGMPGAEATGTLQ